MRVNKKYFDASFNEKEQLPRQFTVNFESIKVGSKLKTHVTINNEQIGDVIDDNSKENDNYRFHDIFHYTFATMLGWSPCTRAMMKRKRKSEPTVDEIEDGARATITEEAISLLLFKKAKQNNFFRDKKISTSLIQQIKELTSDFEVHVRTKKEWEIAILKGYELFRNLVKHNGGRVHFDMVNKTALFETQ